MCNIPVPSFVSGSPTEVTELQGALIPSKVFFNICYHIKCSYCFSLDKYLIELDSVCKYSDNIYDP
jgi:hypothetical protein